MTKLSRYILVIIAIIVGAITLPELYWMAFDKPVKVPLVHYSCEIEDFTIFDMKAKKYSDAAGNAYTREEYERLLPLRYITQLSMDERMPDSIKGVESDMHTFSRARSFLRMRPVDFHLPLPKLYPLIESESGRANLELPEDVFRIDWRVDFINCNTNKIDEEKSRLYSAALFHKGFEFPAKIISGLPTTRKSRDDGYLIIDSKDQLFHLKMIKSEPYIHKVIVPEGLQFKFIKCVDNRDRLYYAYLLGEDNGIYILTQDNYKLIRWPIDDYLADKHQLRISGDYFNYNINIQSEDKLKCYALDKNYQLVDTYEYSWTPNSEKTVGKIAASIFPFTFSLESPVSRFIKLYPTCPRGFIWIILNLILVMVQISIIRKRHVELKNNVLDFALILISGIFGFIAVNIFPNKWN